jgi:hypothetical protein
LPVEKGISGWNRAITATCGSIWSCYAAPITVRPYAVELSQRIAKHKSKLCADLNEGAFVAQW